MGILRFRAYLKAPPIAICHFGAPVYEESEIAAKALDAGRTRTSSAMDPQWLLYVALHDPQDDATATAEDPSQVCAAHHI